MLDGVYLILVFASNDEVVNSLAAEITEFEFIGWKFSEFILEANKNIKFYSYVVCFVLSGIFSIFFVDILELIDRKIVIICI